MGAILSILFEFFLPVRIAPPKKEKKKKPIIMSKEGRVQTTDAVKLLLERSRSSIEDGDKDDALASLLHAIRLTSGEASILGITFFNIFPNTPYHTLSHNTHEIHTTTR